MTDQAIVWRGPDQLRPLLVPISSVTQHPDNPRQGDAGAVGASLARFGQQKPIVVQRTTGWIVAGNHTHQGAEIAGELERTLGVGAGADWTHIAVVFSDLDELEAKAYAIADNRTSDLGTYDEDRLARILSELATADSLVGVGYDGDDVDRLIAEIANRESDPLDPTAAWGGMPAYGHEDQESWKAVVVHFRRQEDLDDFLGRLPGASVMPGRSAMWWPPAEIVRLKDKQYSIDKPTRSATGRTKD